MHEADQAAGRGSEAKTSKTAHVQRRHSLDREHDQVPVVASMISSTCSKAFIVLLARTAALTRRTLDRGLQTFLGKLRELELTVTQC